MKKLIIVMMCLLMCACQDNILNLKKVNDFSFEKEILYEYENIHHAGVNNHIEIIGISDEYTYLSVYIKDDLLNKFYRVDRNNNVEFINEYQFHRKDTLDYAIKGYLYNDSIIFGVKESTKKSYNIYMVSKDKKEIIYSNDHGLHTSILLVNDKYMILDEVYRNKIDNKLSTQIHNITQYDLKTKEKEILISSDLLVEVVENGIIYISGVDINLPNTIINDGINQMNDDGFYYSYGEQEFFYDLNKKESIEVKFDEKDKFLGEIFLGNEKMLFNVIGSEYQYFAYKTNDVYSRKKFKLDYRTNILGYMCDDNYMYVQLESSTDRILLRYDVLQDTISQYYHKRSDSNSSFYFDNNQVYFVTRTPKKITIEKCIFTKV